MEDDAGRPEPDGVAPPTEAERQRADNLLRQANLALVRGDKSMARKLRDEAAETAPGMAEVHEAIGDAALAEHRLRAAKDAFALAMSLDPKGASAERKFGETVLALQMVLDPSKILGNDSGVDTWSTGKYAQLFSLALPGLGQLVNGDTVKGAILVVTWLASIVCLGLLTDGYKDVFALFGGRASINPLAVLPLGTAIGAFVFSIGDASAAAKLREQHSRYRPTPPSDQSFEL